MVDPASDLLSVYEQAARSGVPETVVAALQAVVAAKVELTDTLLRQMLAEAVRLKHHQLVLEIGHRFLLTQPQNISILVQTGQSAVELRKFDLATMYFRQGLMHAGTDEERGVFHNALARLMKDHARMDDALYHFQQAYIKTPSANTASNLIMSLQYNAKATLADFYTQSREYSRMFSAPRLQHDLARLDPAKAKSGLRIGFVSGDFVAHSLSALLLDIFRQFTTVGQHQIYLYHTRPEGEIGSITKSYKEQATMFRFVGKLTVDQLAQQIVDDQIDVLVDIAGHTSHSRMPLFLKKPAPVQVGWVCGMMSPCGLETVPYFLADKHMLTPEMRTVCPERLIELPSAYGYNPMVELPVDQRLPVDRTGMFTFGCLNNPCKLHPTIFENWAKILQAVPNSQLRIKINSSDSAHHIRRTFEQLGVSAKRLTWAPPMKSNHDVMKLYSSDIDLCLDTWPCAGMLTTLEAWWMGCPTITLAGETFLHRQSTSVFTQLELPELIATTPDEYVTKAVVLATNRDRLRELRRSTRSRLDATIIRRPAELARGVLSGFEQAWVHWCTTRAPLKALRTAAAD